MAPLPAAVVKASSKLPWPEVGQAAIGADGYGVLEAHNTETPTPTASVAKIITALVILEKKPLKKGEAGPSLTMSASDVRVYEEYAAKNGSLLPVTNGLKLTQYQALQALLLPSANNIADSLAVWAFGSVDAYAEQANTFVKKLGMTQTTVTDASGFSPDTVSTASDLVVLGDAALDHPVLAQIVSQKQTTIPGVGTINNVNTLLGQDGIIGIKTGSTVEAGGTYLTAAKAMVDGEPVTVIVAVMKAGDRRQAMESSLPLVKVAPEHFTRQTIATKDQVVGRASTPWGASSDIKAESNLAVAVWQDAKPAPQMTLSPLSAPAKAGETAGKITLKWQGKTEASRLYLTSPLPQPSLWWRLTHPR